MNSDKQQPKQCPKGGDGDKGGKKKNKPNKANKGAGGPSNNPNPNKNNPKPNGSGGNNTHSISSSEFECPVCCDVMRAPIYVCESGHSICGECCKKLVPPNCPLCQAPIRQTRNFTLEAMIDKIKMPCPNKAAGCSYSMMQGEIDKHALECIFRATDCVFGIVFGKCSWNGPMQTMMEHCKERHGEYTNSIGVDREILMKKLNLDADERILHVFSVGKQVCFLHFKVDTLESRKNAYWYVQILGTASYAKSWTYEVHLYNKREPERKMTYSDRCQPDCVAVKGVLENGQCAVVPLFVLSTFLDPQAALTYKIYVRRTDNKKA